MILIGLLASYGLCFGLMNEKVEAVNKFLYWLPIRRTEEGNLFERMFRCSYCTGFHTGWICCLLLGDVTLSGILLFSFASSAFCFIVDSLLIRIER